MKDNIIQILKLFIVCVVSAAVLAFVNGVTKEPIAKAKESETLSALKSVIPVDEQRNTVIEKDTVIDGSGASYPVYRIMYEDSTVAGLAVKTFSNNGYGGKIVLMLGADADFTITGLYPLEFSETPGLGTKMTKDEFKGQFTGKNTDNFKFKVQKDGGDVAAITSATITSRAVTEAVEKGLIILKDRYKTTDSDSAETEEVENVD